MNDSSPARSTTQTLGWAVFLGCSWTWCIGMFLPVLLVREQGLWGWVVFAIPNVVGAAAMGWVLRTPESSRRILADHAIACRAFSLVTIAFHVFFTLWFVPRLVGLPPTMLVFGLAGLYLLLTMARPRWDVAAAGITWVVSLAMFAAFVTKASRPLPPFVASQSLSILGLSVVCALGFLLCPYLDLTFHRARQISADSSRLAFGLGFGVCFLLMIVFSLFYATSVAPMVGPQWRQHLRPWFGPILAAHMIGQTAFTLAVHGRAIASSPIPPRSLLAELLFLQVALLLGVAASILPAYHGLEAGELIYRLFMSFYGLVFPSYVWICVFPRKEAVNRPALFRALLLAILVASPMYWLGFIEGRMGWLVPGVLTVMAARYLVPASRIVPAEAGGRA